MSEPIKLRVDKLNEVTVCDRNSRAIHPGDTVVLLPPHPHALRTGVYKGVERTAIGWMCLVRFDDDSGCYVTKSDQWRKEQP